MDQKNFKDKNQKFSGSLIGGKRGVKLSKNLEFFKPIERKKHRIEQGNSLQSVIFKKLKRTKDVVLASDADEFDSYGRRIFLGNIKKKRGKLHSDFHTRWVVMRGW